MDSAKLLSGRELVDNLSLKVSDSIPTKGVKEVIPNGSWMERKQIENSLDAHKSLLNYQRIEKHGSLSQAEWLHCLDKAVVTEPKGAYWLHIGHVEDQKTYIYPEEALHLMEMNCLELKYGGVLMSLQQAYTLLIGKSVSPDEYRVYSLLSKQGYKLLRHNTNRKYCLSDGIGSDISDDEQSELSQHYSKKQENKNRIEKTDMETVEVAADTVACEDILSPYTTCKQIFVENSSGLSLVKPGICAQFEKDLASIQGVDDSSHCDNNVNERKSLEIENSILEKKISRVSDASEKSNIIEIKSGKDSQSLNMFDEIDQNPIEIANEPLNVDLPQTSVSNSMDVIDVELYDITLGNKNKFVTPSSAVGNSELKETIIEINANKNVDSPGMRVDSSSDDCLIVDESLKIYENPQKSSQRESKISANESMKSHSSKYVKNNRDKTSNRSFEADNNKVEEMEVINIDEVSVASKLKILQRIIDCYNKNVVHVKTPEKYLIPANIDLAKPSYYIRIDKFSSKRNLVSGNIENCQPLSYGCSFANRAHPNLRRSSDDSGQMTLHSSHNHLFWNHIFHQLRMQSQNDNSIRRFGSRSNLFGDCRVSKVNLHFPSKFTAPFSLRTSQFSNDRRYSNLNRRRISSDNSILPRTFFYNDNIRNHVNKSNFPKRIQDKRQIERICRSNISDTRYHVTLESNEQRGISQSEALKQLKNLMNIHNSLDNEEKPFELTDTLKKAVDAYNRKFKQKFVADYDENLKIFSIVENETQKIVQVSPNSVSKNIKEKCADKTDSKKTRKRKLKKRTRREMKQRRLSKIRTDAETTSTEESVCFSTEEKEQEKYITTGILSSRNFVASASVEGPNADGIISDGPENMLPKDETFDRIIKEGEFKSWDLDHNSWNRPELSKKSLRTRRIEFTNMNLSSAYVYNIKELSYNVQSPVNSWSRAKQLYENERSSNTVFISDEEENISDSDSSGTLAIMTDKTVPLVRPQDCKSTETVLKRLQIVKCSRGTSYPNTIKEATELKISYDLYSPSFKTLKKSRLPLPNYSIVVLSHSSSLPTPVELSSRPDNVPILFAIISFDAVSFVQMENVDLPILVRESGANNID